MTSRISILADGCFAPKFLHSSFFDKEEKIQQAIEFCLNLLNLSGNM